MSCSVLLSAWPICSEPVTFGRRDHDGEGLGARLRAGAGAEGVGLLPDLRDLRLDGFGVVGLFKHGNAVRAVRIVVGPV